MKENFSKRVQNIMKYGKEEAIRLGHSYIGSEHLLLALLRESSGKSAKIFDIYDCDIDDIRAMVEDMIKTSGGTMTLGHLPLTRRAERIMVSLSKTDEDFPIVTLQYINRLSDYFFALARVINYRCNVKDVEYIRSANVFSTSKVQKKNEK